MTDTERSVAVLTKKGYAEIRDVAFSLIRRLVEAGFKVYSVASLKHRSAENVATISDLKAQKPDTLVTVGGDGTLLWVLREMDDETPVLGVNVGGRGILSEVRPEEIDGAAERLRKSEYVVEERMRLSTSIGSKTLPPALNEVYLNRASQIRTSTFGATIGGFTVRQKMDGLIISTPTGSTGHSLSFGGPFIHPCTSVLLLLPIAPLNRLPPLILPAEKIEIASDHDSVLVIDGQEATLMKASETVMIARHPRNARFIRFEAEGLRQLAKLGF